MQDCFVSRLIETDPVFLEKNLSMKCLQTDEGRKLTLVVSARMG